MNLAEYNYQIHDKEMLKSQEEKRPELQQKQDRFQIYTDHKSLEYFMTTKQLTGGLRLFQSTTSSLPTGQARRMYRLMF